MAEHNMFILYIMITKSLENDTELFETLLLSYPERLDAVQTVMQTVVIPNIKCVPFISIFYIVFNKIYFIIIASVVFAVHPLQKILLNPVFTIFKALPLTLFRFK